MSVKQWTEICFELPVEMEERLGESLARRGWAQRVVTEETQQGLKVKAYVLEEEKSEWLAMMAMEGLSITAEKTRSEYEWTQSEGEEIINLCPGVRVHCGTSPPPVKAPNLLHIPGSPAFGDGRHPATRMAAQLLQPHVRGQRVLDLGCGSGILGMAALMLGAESVDFSDLDDDSLRVSKELLRLNGLSARRIFASDLLGEVQESYGVIVANIYADLAVRLVGDEKLNHVLDAGGHLVLSGLHQDKFPLVAAAMDAFEIIELREDLPWMALKAVHKC